MNSTTAMRFVDTNVLTEDMQDGQDFAGVKVVNPFKP
jgi:predicted nucleic acid-binding protein